MEAPILLVEPRMPVAFYSGPTRAPALAPLAPQGLIFYSSDGDGRGRGAAGPRRTLFAITLALAVVLVLVVLYHVACSAAPRRPSGAAPGDQEGFARSSTPHRSLVRGLERRGWTVYLLEGCGFCQKQMGLLDGFDRYVLYSGGELVGGYATRPPVQRGSIDGFPHWYNTRTGERRGGFQDRAALEQMAR
jgi:hypothetical protein